MPLEEKTQKTAQNLDLQSLLDKNRKEGLTSEEDKRARELIVNPEYSDRDCWCCRMSTPGDIGKAIYDTGLCKSHANYALISRK